IVRVPKPWYAPRSLVEGRMRDTVGEYERLPGLLFKAYSLERSSGDFGGLYHWRSGADAAAWFNAGWFDRIRRDRGVEPSVRFFDAPLSVDNSPGGTKADLHSEA